MVAKLEEKKTKDKARLKLILNIHNQVEKHQNLQKSQLPAQIKI